MAASQCVREQIKEAIIKRINELIRGFNEDETEAIPNLVDRIQSDRFPEKLTGFADCLMNCWQFHSEEYARDFINRNCSRIQQHLNSNSANQHAREEIVKTITEEISAFVELQYKTEASPQCIDRIESDRFLDKMVFFAKDLINFWQFHSQEDAIKFVNLNWDFIQRWFNNNM